jgi:hypothetical protein
MRKLHMISDISANNFNTKIDEFVSKHVDKVIDTKFSVNTDTNSNGIIVALFAVLITYLPK